MDRGTKYGILIAMVTLLLSVGGNLATDSYRQGSVDSRLVVLEQAESVGKLVNDKVLLLEVTTTANTKRLDQQLLNIVAIGDATQTLSSRISLVEVNGAVTNQVLKQLTTAVTELSTSTRELGKIITKVAVLETRVDGIEGGRNGN